MRKVSKISVVFLFCFLSLGFSSVDHDPTQFKVEVKNVHLPLLIFDKGQAIKLEKDNFRVFEGEKKPDGNVIWTEQNIENLSRYENQAIAFVGGGGYIREDRDR